MTLTNGARNVPAARTRALVIAALWVGTASPAQTQAPPPTAAECAALIRMAQDEKQRQKMTKDELRRTSVCLSLLKKPEAPPASIAPIKIFKD